MVPGPYMIIKTKLVSMGKSWAGMIGHARSSSCHELTFTNKDRKKKLIYFFMISTEKCPVLRNKSNKK